MMLIEIAVFDLKKQGIVLIEHVLLQGWSKLVIRDEMLKELKRV